MVKVNKEINKDLSKDTNTTVQEKPKSKKRGHQWEDYFNTNYYAMAPANNEFKQRIAQEMIDYVTNTKDCYDIEEFLDKVGIVPDTWYKWCKKDEALQDQYHKTKRIIGRRRERIGIEKGQSVNSVTAFCLPQYLTTWRKEVDHRAKIGKAEKEDTKFVVIPDFGTTDIKNKGE